MRYDAIFEWGMTPIEVEAYKLACLYEQEFLKLYKGSDDLDGQGYRRNTLPKRGDPRKSNLYRYCWKLRRETRGLLTPEQYQTYVVANLTILQMNNAHVEPNAICGDKAWVRWKLWDRWMREKLAEKSAVVTPIKGANPKILKDIDKTKKFLFEKCEGKPTYEKIKGFLDSGFFKMWVASGKVSPYYVIMSSYTKEHIQDLSQTCSFDPRLLQEKATKEVRAYFKEEFAHEDSHDNA